MRNGALTIRRVSGGLFMVLVAGCAATVAGDVAHKPVPGRGAQWETGPAPTAAVRRADYAEAVRPAKPQPPPTHPNIQLASVVAENRTSKSISSVLGDAAAGLSDMLTPEERVERAPDATSLTGQPAKPSAKLYVSFARLYEQNNRLGEAEKQYQLALKMEPNDLEALLGYGRLKERVGTHAEATGLYQAAARAHPNEPAPFNHLGLAYARRGMLSEAKQAFERAIQLRPKNPGLRNHVAIVLVEMNRTNEAFAHLRVVHGDAIAHYNIGCALHKKGETQAAAQHFAAALQRNPNLVQARQWLDWLASQPAASQGIGRTASQRQWQAPSSGSRQFNGFPGSGASSQPIRPLSRPGQTRPTGPSHSTLPSPRTSGLPELAPLPPVKPSSKAAGKAAGAPRMPLAPPKQPGQTKPDDQVPVAPLPPAIQPLPPVGGTNASDS